MIVLEWRWISATTAVPCLWAVWVDPASGGSDYGWIIVGES